MAVAVLLLLIAIPAVDRANTGRLKGNLSFNAAGGAVHRVVLALTAVFVGGLFSRATARRAAGRLILKALFSVKFLFGNAEDEFDATIFTYQSFVFHCDSS